MITALRCSLNATSTLSRQKQILSRLLPKAKECLLAAEKDPIVRQGKTATLVTHGAIAKLNLVQEGKLLGIRRHNKHLSVVVLEIDFTIAEGW